MLKMLREKVLVSLVVVLLVAVTIGNVVSLATEPTVTINPTTGNNVGVTITTDSNKNTNANTNSLINLFNIIFLISSSYIIFGTHINVPKC